MQLPDPSGIQSHLFIHRLSKRLALGSTIRETAALLSAIALGQRFLHFKVPKRIINIKVLTLFLFWGSAAFLGVFLLSALKQLSENVKLGKVLIPFPAFDCLDLPHAQQPLQ